MHSYEIEIKSLLGSKDKADDLIAKMGKDSSFQAKGSHKQLNHYFSGGDLNQLFKNLEHYIDPAFVRKFQDIANKAKDFSVRTRQADKDVLVVIKASIDDTTSQNGIARIEFEAKTPKLTLEQLDGLILKSGFEYQAKWSRERQEFKYKNIDVTVDKNAGYGYLAEFETQVADPALADETKKRLREVMAELDALELAQDRLERMFAHYNQNWRDYYGTDKTFIIE